MEQICQFPDCDGATPNVPEKIAYCNHHKVWLINTRIFLSFKFNTDEIKYLPSQDIIFISQHLNGCWPNELQPIIDISSQCLQRSLTNKKVVGQHRQRSKVGGWQWWIPVIEMVRVLILTHNWINIHTLARLTNFKEHTLAKYIRCGHFGLISHDLKGCITIHRRELADLKLKCLAIQNRKKKRTPHNRFKNEDEYSPQDLARLTNIPEATYRTWMLLGWLVAQKRHSYWVVGQNNLDNFVNKVLAKELNTLPSNFAKIQLFYRKNHPSKE